MLAKTKIIQYLNELNQELAKRNVRGELCLYGGAVMTLVYDARPSTKDVDAVFKPTAEIREATLTIARRHGLDEGWLNDGVKGFLVAHEQEVFLSLSHLNVYVPHADYLLAMKAMAARVDAMDKEDLQFLIKKLDVKNAEDVFKILEKYYKKNQIRPATQFFIEELFE